MCAGVIWLSDGSPVCPSDQHPWRHTCADDMHELNAWSCQSAWLAVSGDNMQTIVSVCRGGWTQGRRRANKHGRQRASQAFNEEQQINDTSDFTETFSCSLYRINQTTKNLQCGYVILHEYGKNEEQTLCKSCSLRTWLHIKKVWTLSQTHIYVCTHTHTGCAHICAQTGCS